MEQPCLLPVELHVLSNSHASTRVGEHRRYTEKKLNHFSHSLSIGNKFNWWRVPGYEIVQPRESRMQQDGFFSETLGFELEVMVCAVRDGTLIDQWQEKHRNVKFSYQSCLSSPLVCSRLKEDSHFENFRREFRMKNMIIPAQRIIDCIYSLLPTRL